MLAWVLSLVLLTLSLVPGVGPRPLSRVTGGADTAEAYPQRVGFVRGAPTLPARPGALSLVVNDNNFGSGAYEALDAQGRAWTVPTWMRPSLSPDGTLLATMVPAHDARLVVQDLVTGQRRTYDTIGYTSGYSDEVPADFRLATDGLVAWSGDQATALVLGRRLPGLRGERTALLDLAAGTLTEVPATGTPVGFLGDDEVVTVRSSGDESAPTRVAWVADPAAGTARPVTLRPADPAVDKKKRVSYAITPSGALLVVDASADGQQRLREFSLDDGRELSARAVDLDGVCGPVGWRGDDPVLSTKRYGRQAQAIQVTPDGTRSLVAVHPRLQSFCVTIAEDALAGGPTRMLFGTWSARWTWYWRQTLIVVLGVGGLVLLLRWRRKPVA